MKKRIAIVLSVVLALGCFSGCGKQEAQTPAATETSTTASETVANSAKENGNSASEAKASVEPVTLTIGVCQNSNVENYDTNYLTKYLEENVGVDLDFYMFSADSTEAATQLALMVASGEKLPDIIWGMLLDINTVYEYGEDGYFIELNDYIKNQAPNFNEGLNKLPASIAANAISYGTDPKNGKFYGMPKIEYEPGTCSAFASINKNWLEAIGADMPRTTDELYDVLNKFKTEDPNKNGIIDEIPMVFYPGWCADLSEYLVNPFVYCNDDYVFNATDGKLWTPYTTDEYRQAMIYLNKLTTEGLISPMSYTMNSESHGEMAALFTPSNGVAISGVVGGQPDLTTEGENMVIAEYTALPPLTAATDLGGYAVYDDASYSYSTFITSDCENPDKAFELLDFMYKDETFITMRWGEEGVEWEYLPADSTGKTVYGVNAVMKVLDGSIWSSQQNKVWSQLASTICRFDIYNNIFVQDGSWSSTKTQLFADIFDAYASAPLPKERVYNLIYTSDENDVVSECQAMIKNYIAESRSSFATGILDPNNDADWQNYLDNLESLGLSNWLNVAQSAYTRMTE